MKCETVRGLVVKLRVEGKDLEEYSDENCETDSAEDDSRTVRYVEAVTGAHFSIELRLLNDFLYKYDDVQSLVTLDGKLLENSVYRADPSQHYVRRSIKGLARHANTGWQLEKFTFADLETNDEHPVQPNLKEQLKNIGEVTVELLRCRHLGNDDGANARARSTHEQRFEPTVGSDGIPEKALKGRALSKRAILINPEPCLPLNIVKLEWPWGNKPFATFTFRYRSHKDLQVEGVIPRSPSPVPLENRERSTLNEQEMRELIRLQDERLRNQVRVKREKREREDEGGDENDGEVTLIEERRKRARTSTDSGIEVIDLSNEDDEDDD